MSDEITIKPRTESGPTAPQPKTPTPAAAPEKPSFDLSPYLVLCAAGLLASFFMPWVTILFGHPSGFDLQRLGDLHKLYWSIPVFSGVAIIAALTKRSQRTAAQIAGAVPYAILIYWLAKAGSDATNLLNNLNYGAYVALACGLGLEIVARRLK